MDLVSEIDVEAVKTYLQSCISLTKNCYIFEYSTHRAYTSPLAVASVLRSSSVHSGTRRCSGDKPPFLSNGLAEKLKSPYVWDVGPRHWMTRARRFETAWCSHLRRSKCPSRMDISPSMLLWKRRAPISHGRSATSQNNEDFKCTALKA
jgi:hypothetical protein